MRVRLCRCGVCVWVCVFPGSLGVESVLVEIGGGRGGGGGGGGGYWELLRLRVFIYLFVESLYPCQPHRVSQLQAFHSIKSQTLHKLRYNTKRAHFANVKHM